MNKIKLIIITLSFTTAISAQEVLNLNREECRKMAIEKSEVVKIAEENVSKAQGEKMAARSAWFPNISASATGIYSQHDIERELYLPTQSFDMATGELNPNIALNPLTGEPIIGPDGNPVFNTYAYLPIDIGIYGGAIAGVSAEQPIYAGGRIIAGNKMANTGENMALENKQLKQVEIICETDQMYYNYLSVKEKLKLAKNYEALLAELVRVLQDSYETGMVNRNELLKVKVKYNEASLGVQNAESGLELSRMVLCRLIGADFSTPIEINDSISNVVFDSIYLESVPASERAEYRLLEGKVRMAEQQVNMVRGDYLPSVGVSAGYNYFNLGLHDMDNYDSHGFSAIASVKIPITTFGERKGKVTSAKADYNIRQFELEQAEQYLQLEIEQARFNYVNAYKRVEMAEEALEQANESMKVSDDNYQLGMETIADLLEAKAQWQNTYSNKIDALTDFKIKESKYLKVTNQLNVY